MGVAALPPQAVILEDVRRALEEDLGSGDLTAGLLPEGARARARIVVKEDGAFLAGSAWAEACFRALDPGCGISWSRPDGERMQLGEAVCIIAGNARALVSAERSALNFLQTLSGTATATAGFVAAVQGTRATILDTRKTLPGLRQAQKYAVRCGGGTNHRMGLYDAVLVKENHIAAAGSIARAVAQARTLAPGVLLEVEVESLAQLGEALDCGVDRVMLDELSRDDIARAVALAAGRCALEISGGVGLDTVRELAATGVDFISIGALTKHVRAVDFSLRLEG